MASNQIISPITRNFQRDIFLLKWLNTSPKITLHTQTMFFYCSLKYGDLEGLMTHVNGGSSIMGIRQETMIVSDMLDDI